MKSVYLDMYEPSVEPVAESLIDKKLRSEGFIINRYPKIKLIPAYEANKRINLPISTGYKKITVSDFEVNPSIENPLRVSLNVSENMMVQLWRDELKVQIPNQKFEDELDNIQLRLIEMSHKDTDKYTIDADIRNYLLERIEKTDVPQFVICRGMSVRNPTYVV